MREGTIHPNDCGNCRHWAPWTDEEWLNYCKDLLRMGLAMPDKRWDLGWCDKIPKGTVFCEEGYTFAGDTFADECYDENLHCFEEVGTDG